MNIIDPTQFATVTATEPSSLVSHKYSMASTAQVLQALEGHGWLPVGYYQKKANSPLRSGKQTHTVLLGHKDLQDGKTLPRIMLKNSHDGTGSLQFLSGLFERICANGLIVGASAEDVRITHRSITEQKILQGVERTVQGLQRALSLSERMRSVSLDREQQLQFAEKVIELVWDGEKYGTMPNYLLFNHRSEQRAPTLWNTFNTVQERVIRGGTRLYRADGGRTTARAITAIDRNISANRAMWNVAEEALGLWQ